MIKQLDTCFVAINECHIYVDFADNNHYYRKCRFYTMLRLHY